MADHDDAVDEPVTSTCPEVKEPPPVGDTPDDGRRGRARTACAAGMIAVAALGGTAGWFGYRSYEGHHADVLRSEWVQVARQGAVNLTTIDYTRVEADIQRILDSSTGAFHDDFQKRSQPFIDVVKQVQSKSEGTVTAAGLESQDDNQAQVLLAVSVKTTSVAAPEQKPRAWRMRISVQDADGERKVSNVQFVP